MAAQNDDVYGASTDEEEDDEDWTRPIDDPIQHPNSSKPLAMLETGNQASKSMASAMEEKTGDLKASESAGTDKDGLLSRMKLNDHKAGMQGLDRERINKIIFEASKGSRFYENEQKREQQVTARISEQQRRRELLTESQIAMGVVEADALLMAIEKTRSFSRSIVHVDMDAFYAAVEMRDNPKLRHVPMAVGGSNMLSTSNYLARRFGVRAAMPGFIGKKLCPQLVIVPCNFDKYTAVSKEVRAIMADYDPNFSPMSLDEAYLDFTNHMEKRQTSNTDARTFQVMLKEEEICRCGKKDGIIAKKGSKEEKSVMGSREEEDDLLQKTSVGEVFEEAEMCPSCRKYVSEDGGSVEEFGTSVEEAVREMRARIHWKTKLTASAGIAPNTMLAKVCSDLNKPNGQYYLRPSKEVVMKFIRNLDIRKIGGVGKVAERMLQTLGVQKCGDLYTNRGVLYHLYSKISFNYFMRITLGIGSTTVERDGERKSMSVERTFRELRDPKDLYQKCLELSESLSDDLRGEQIVGKTVGIKLKTVNFELMTKARSIACPTDDPEQIYGAASELLRAEIQLALPNPLKLRLMGVRMSNLSPKNSISDQQGTIKTMIEKMKSTPKPKPEDGTPSSQHPSLLTNPGVIPDTQNTETPTTPTKTQKLTDMPQGKAAVGKDTDKLTIKTMIEKMKSTPKPKPEDGTPSSQQHSLLTNCGVIPDTQNTETPTTPTKTQKLAGIPQVKAAAGKDTDKPTIKTMIEKMKSTPKPKPEDGTPSSQHPSLPTNCGIIPDAQNTETPTTPTKTQKLIDMPQGKAAVGKDTGIPTDGGCSLLRSGKKIKPSQSYTCPVCCKEMSLPDLGTFNSHIDACLSQGSETHCDSGVGVRVKTEQGEGLGENLEEKHTEDSKLNDSKDKIKKVQECDTYDRARTVKLTTEGKDHKCPIFKFSEVQMMERVKDEGSVTLEGGLYDKFSKNTICDSASRMDTEQFSEDTIRSHPPGLNSNVHEEIPTMNDSKPGQSVPLKNIVPQPQTDSQQSGALAKERPSIFPKRKVGKALDLWLKQDLNNNNNKSKIRRTDPPNPIAPPSVCVTEKRVEKMSSKPRDYNCGEGTSSGTRDDSLICPICNTVQKNRNLILFNKHIDLCLGKQSTEDNLPPIETEKHSTTDRAANSNSDKNKNQRPGKNNGAVSKGGDIRAQSEDVVVSKIIKDWQVEEEEEECHMTCPVCTLCQTWLSFKAFNNHVEACLNRSAIKELLQAESSAEQAKRRRISPSSEEKQSKKKKPLPNVKTIESFFKKR